VPLMVRGFAIECPLARHVCLLSAVCSSGSHLCSTLLSDPASRRRPCASLSLHLHQVVKRTSTSKLSNMLGTHSCRIFDPAVDQLPQAFRLAFEANHELGRLFCLFLGCGRNQAKAVQAEQFSDEQFLPLTPVQSQEVFPSSFGSRKIADSKNAIVPNPLADNLLEDILLAVVSGSPSPLKR